MAEPTPIDPLAGPKLALGGRVVTMNASNRVINNGVIYIEAGRIVAVLDNDVAPPDGFQKVSVTHTDGTIFPGLIELHNHLPYDVLPLWRVPKAFRNRSQWGGTEEYQRLITKPMSVLGRAQFVPSVARYVECKTLIGGVTTSQGIELFSNQGARRFYKGLVRNVEQTDDDELPEAMTRIADVEAKNARRFLARLKKGKRLILHLSEGVGAKARAHFLALHISGREWAINENLVGIHCTGLQKRDFGVMARHGASMVWSPLSNLLLYGETADVAAARAEGIKIGLGSDWSPTGSKNLLGELKVARLYVRAHDIDLSDRDLVAMATRDAAEILGWQAQLGSLEAGKRADLMVVDDDRSDPYVSLMRSSEANVRLVMIGGVARVGVPSLVQALAGRGEEVRIGGRQRMFYLQQDTADDVVEQLSFKKATATLRRALADLPKAARSLPAPNPKQVEWRLALDELVDNDVELRPRLPVRPGEPATGPALPRTLPVVTQVSSTAITLDSLAVADDDKYLDLIAEEEQNVPSFVSQRLRSLYE